MKKLLLTSLIALTLLGCNKIEEKVDEAVNPKYEKITDVSDLLDEILTHIAEADPELSFDDGTLVDTKLGIPRYEITSFTEIDHFNPDEVEDGYVVRPVVEVDNPHLLIIMEANDKASASNLNNGMKKVLSDQIAEFHDEGLLEMHLVNMNKTTRQGNYLIYVTWNGAEEITHVFERHVK